MIGITFPSRVKWQIFTSPAFIFALAVFVLNDYFLKAAFGNWVTGKLSDFAGLFVFVQVFAAFFPHRSKVIALVTAAAFIYWKSPASQPLIDGWNALAPFPIARTIDSTDLLALISLPAAHLYFKTLREAWAPRIIAYPTLIAAALAIMGTSVVAPTRSLEVQLRGRPEASVDTVHIVLDDVAHAHGMQCIECNAGQSYRRYEGAHQWLYANFDTTGQILFVRLLAGDERNLDAIAGRIRAEIAERLKSTGRDVVVQDYKRISFHDEKKLVSARAPVSASTFFECSLNNAPRQDAFFEELDKYAHARRYDDSFTGHCYGGYRCRAYHLGRVIGPAAYDRAIMVNVYGNCLGMFATSEYVSFDITARAEDPSVNVGQIASDLKELLERFAVGEVEMKSEK